MEHEGAAKHLSASHTFCWRTLAVTLELFPTLYRTCLFQLALIPPGLLVPEGLLQVRCPSSGLSSFGSACVSQTCQTVPAHFSCRWCR